MKKVVIILLIILLGTAFVIIPNMKGSTDNSFTIEYQQNKNLAMPDLTGATEISPNTYRLFEIGVITLDYNIINGNYISNTPGGQQFGFLSFNVEIGQEYTLSAVYISGSSKNPYRVLVDGSYIGLDIRINETITFTPMTSTNIIIGYSTSQIDDNFTFKLQLEKGDTATPYTVPKLVPVYVDNLTYKEKQEIGLGAFTGITNIIKTIDNVITPITDMFNAIIDFFN